MTTIITEKEGSFITKSRHGGSITPRRDCERRGSITPRKVCARGNLTRPKKGLYTKSTLQEHLVSYNHLSRMNSCLLWKS